MLIFIIILNFFFLFRQDGRTLLALNQSRLSNSKTLCRVFIFTSRRKPQGYCKTRKIFFIIFTSSLRLPFLNMSNVLWQSFMTVSCCRGKVGASERQWKAEMPRRLLEFDSGHCFINSGKYFMPD